MKKKIYVVAVILFVIIMSISWSVIGFTKKATNYNDLEVKTNIAKSNYVLGEPVNIEFEIYNQGNKTENIPSKGVETGSLKIFVSRQNQDYKRYVTSGWGRFLDPGAKIEPGASHIYQATILWNNIPDVSHLSPVAASRMLADKITSEYAFPTSGIYIIKGVMQGGQNLNGIEFISMPIIVSEPVADDLKVWNQIKGNREIALLMQSSEFDTIKNEEKRIIIEEVEKIINQYPNSIYSKYLKPNLQKFLDKEAKRVEFHKMKQ